MQSSSRAPTANVTLINAVPKDLQMLHAATAHKQAHRILEPFYDCLEQNQPSHLKEFRHGMIWFICACLLMLRKGILSRDAGLEECCNPKYGYELVIINSILVSTTLNPEGTQVDPEFPGCSMHRILRRAGSAIEGYIYGVRDMGGRVPEGNPLLTEVWLFKQWYRESQEQNPAELEDRE
jgi:hypothetical protein